MLDLPLEPIYVETIIGSSAQSERERNAQQKKNWQNKCQQLIEIGIMCGEKPWPLVGRKTVSLLYSSIEVQGRRILNCKNLHNMIDSLSPAEFWKIVEDAFISTGNITFDRHVFLITKQLREETVEHFYRKQKELAENCDFENKEETMIRDVFITNLIDPEIQKEPLKQTEEPRQTLKLAINMKLGMRNQHQIQQHNKTLIRASVNAIQFPSNVRSSNCSFSNSFQKPNGRSSLYCSNCGGNWLTKHCYKCITKGEICNNCQLMNHFAKVCRKQKNPNPQNSKKHTLNTVDEEPHPKNSENSFGNPNSTNLTTAVEKIIRLR